MVKWKPYDEDVDTRTNGTLIKEVNTIHEVLVYCCTHVHPDLEPQEPQ